MIVGSFGSFSPRVAVLLAELLPPLLGASAIGSAC